MSLIPNDDRLGRMLREAAGGAAPLSLNAAGARRRADSRRRRTVATVTLGTVAASAAVVAISFGSSGVAVFAPEPAKPPAPVSTSTAEPTEVAPEPSPVSTPTTEPVVPEHSPSPSPVSTPTTDAEPVDPEPSTTPSLVDTPEPARLELRGDHIGVTAFGDTRAEAVAAVSAVLGPPSENPAVSNSSCVDARSEVMWGSWPTDFVLAFDAENRLSGWSSGRPGLVTPSGVGPGTAVATLKQVYGDKLNLYPPNTDNGPTYGVDGVDMTGYLTDMSASGTVQRLDNGNCHPV